MKPVKVLSGDNELANDGHAQLRLSKDVGLPGMFGITAIDGGGFCCVLMSKESWEAMKSKIDAFLDLSEPEKP